MRKKILVFCFTLLFMAVIAGTEFLILKDENIPFSATIHTENGEEQIKCWNRGGVYYLFLPSGTDLSQVSIQTNPLYPISFQDVPIKNGSSCRIFPLNEEFSIGLKRFLRSRISVPVCIMRSENVPSMFIDTASGSMEYIHEAKGNAESGIIRLYTADGEKQCTAQIAALNGRGNSTWEVDKKPYSIELSVKEDLLGMGAAKRWILLANAVDSTHICNKMTYDFARIVGDVYAPESRWVDLYLNGEYGGLYLLTERNEVDPQRIDISSDGSFLLSVELDARWDGTNYPAFFSDRNHFFRIRHEGMPLEQIKAVWQAAEDALYAEDGIDPKTGKYWTELMDVESWAHQWLFSEVFSNHDSGASSIFFYYEEAVGKLFGGPIWDMDSILNKIEILPPNRLNCQCRYIYDRERDSLFYLLYQKEEFRDTVHRLYWEVYRPLLLNLAESKMEQYMNMCISSIEMDGIRWFNSEFHQMLQERKESLLAHMAFLEEYWQNEQDYCTIEVLEGNQWRSYGVRLGENVEFVNRIEGIPEDPCWIDYETGEPFDISQPLYENRVIVLGDMDENEGDEE